jgi:hypothetical protein
MAANRWQGGAAAVAQVTTWTFGGTWTATDTITVTIGSKSYTVTTGSATLATLLATLQAALAGLSSSSFPEFAEVTWTNPTGTTLVGTAATAGVPFTATLTTSSAAGTISAASTTASSGPNDWSTAPNWSRGVIPQGSVNAPALNAPALASGGALTAGTTYYYKLTAFNANGETTPSAEMSATPSGANLAISHSWTAMGGATGYKLYRGTAAGSENTLVATINSGTATSFTDTGDTATTASPPASNTATIPAPTQNATSLAAGGSLTSGTTYYYVVTALTAAGETTKSNEQSATPSGGNLTTNVNWAAVTGATGYKIYRSTTSGTYGASSLLTTIASGATVTYADTGSATTTGTPPASNTATLPAPTSSACSTAATGGALAAATWYYKTTALTAAGETTPAAEQAQTTTGTASTVTVNWAALTGATGYKVYRGTTPGNENLLIATLGAGSASFTDDGGTLTAASPPGSNTATADDAYLDGTADDIQFGMNQTGIILNSLNILASFEGTLGLPKENTTNTAYPEYRPDYLQIGALTVNVGQGVGAGSGRVKHDAGSVACSWNVYGTGEGLDTDTEALLLKGSNPSNSLTVVGPSQVGVAIYGTETANLSGGLTLGSGATVRCMSGVTLAVVTNNGGNLVTYCAIGTSLTQIDGDSNLNGTGAIAALTLRGGTCEYNTEGTLGSNPIVSGSGLLDFSGDQRTKTVTNPIQLYGTEAQVLDPNKVVTGGAGLVIQFKEGAVASQVDFGLACTLTRS